MALIQYGPAVAGISGSVAGTTFARNSAGAYMRNRTKPVYPASDAQVLAAANMSSQVAAWANDLTVAQRDAWNALAARTNRSNKLGQPFTPSGFNLYMRSNMLLLLTGQAAIIVPPTNVEIPAPAITLAHVPATGIQVTSIGAFDNTPVGKYLHSHSPNLRQTINFFKGPFTFRGVGDMDDWDVLPHTIEASASLAIDTRKYISFVAVYDDGGCSAAATYSVDVGDPV